MTVLQRKNWMFLQRSALTLHINHMLLAEGERSSTIPHEGFENTIMVIK